MGLTEELADAIREMKPSVIMTLKLNERIQQTIDAAIAAADVVKLRQEVEMWKRRAEQHGCDVVNGDPDCG